MKLLICGSRGWNGYRDMERVLDIFRANNEVTEIISGGARGADSCAKIYADRHKIPCTVIKPDWALGKGAGFARNLQMLELCDEVIAFWDGESKGTKHTIANAQARNIPIAIVINTAYRES